MAAAKDFFPVLKTFVVPMLPDPTSLISFFKNNLVSISPKGIEPNKYEKIETIIIVTYYDVIIPNKKESSTIITAKNIKY